MGRITKLVAYGLGGIALALAMSLGAFALAGNTLSHPTPTVRIVDTTQTAQPHPSTEPWIPSWSPDPHVVNPVQPVNAATSTPTASAGPNTHGGTTQATPTPSGDDDNSGSGDDDHDDD